ncbi:MFS transporter [Novosphingobium sp.]|uniref:MFS transporter n=1 Tax=Novosphingobium sp. TaxID=1874826 RepID=UPI003B52F973
MSPRTRLILAMALTYLAYGMMLNTVGTVILRAIASLGVTKAGAGWFDGCKDVSIAAVSFLTASYLTRIGIRRAMTGALALSVAACLLMPLASAYWAICLHFVMIGTAFAFIKVGIYTLIGQVTDSPRAHAAMASVIEGCFMVGVLGVSVLFSLFVGRGLVDTSHDWLNLYWILAGLCAACLALMLTTSPDRPAPSGETQSIPAMLALARLPLVMVFILCAFSYVFVEQGIGTWLPTFNNEVLRMPQSMSVLAGSLFAGALALGRLGGGVVIARFGWYRVVNVSLGAVALAIMAIVPLSHHLSPAPVSDWAHAPLAMWLFLAIGLFMAPIYPTLVSVLLSSSPKVRHAELMGLVVIFSALGGTTGSRLTAMLFSGLDGATAFGCMVVPIAVLAVGVTMLRRRQMLATVAD